MYVASQLDGSWLLIVQGKLYAQSRENPDYVFRKLWGLITDRRNLRIALSRVAQNQGRRTAGVDGLTVRTVLEEGVEAFVEHVRAELKSGVYRPARLARANFRLSRPSPFPRVCVVVPASPQCARSIGAQEEGVHASAPDQAVHRSRSRRNDDRSSLLRRIDPYVRARRSAVLWLVHGSALHGRAHHPRHLL